MKIGDYIRVINSYNKHSTRWGGMTGHIVEIDLLNQGHQPMVKIRTRLNRTFIVSEVQCELIKE